tara:strand:- start:1684 stop:2373 length:690 start_codon:yes stop_codon:yes gene_type:complete
MIPLFKTHFSIGKSILRIDDVDRICTDNNIEEVFLVEDTMCGFPEAFRTFKDRLRFGIRFSIYNEDLSEESESKMIAFANGDEGAKELYSLYTQQFDKKITQPWDHTKHLQYVVPFYDSFLHKNLTTFSNCMVSVPSSVPFFIERNGLPFDIILEEKIVDYIINTFGNVDEHIELAKSIYYENKEDVEAFQTYKCICNRQPGRQASLSNPRLDHFGSDRFCVEAWKEDK